MTFLCKYALCMKKYVWIGISLSDFPRLNRNLAAQFHDKIQHWITEYAKNCSSIWLKMYITDSVKYFSLLSERCCIRYSASICSCPTNVRSRRQAFLQLLLSSLLFKLFAVSLFTLLWHYCCYYYDFVAIAIGSKHLSKCAALELLDN